MEKIRRQVVDEVLLSSNKTYVHNMTDVETRLNGLSRTYNARAAVYYEMKDNVSSKSMPVFRRA